MTFSDFSPNIIYKTFLHGNKSEIVIFGLLTCINLFLVVYVFSRNQRKLKNSANPVYNTSRKILHVNLHVQLFPVKKQGI